MNYQKYFTQHFLGIVVFLQVIMYLTLFLNFTLAREVIGIFYLTFIPGFVFLKLLKLELETTEFILYLLALASLFLMMAGLLINQFGPMVGISFPLATLPLSLLINTIVLGATAVAYLKQGKIKENPFPNSKFPPVVFDFSVDSTFKHHRRLLR